MKENAEAMEAEGIPYVLYPHWIHQMWFECRVCHTGIFIPKRGANNLNKTRILNGELCGRCHDGKIAFEAKTNCKKCHTVGTPDEKRLRDVEHVDMEMIAKTADKLGVTWRPDRLPDGQIPVDKFSFVDWGWLNKMEVYESVAKVDGIEPRTETHDSKILYPSSMSFIKDAVFDHAVHTPRMLCEHCHPKVFKEELGATSTRMSAMGEGEACGYCHGKTAFKLADCNRCHTRTADEPMEKGMLLHHKRPE
jgi:c(7)-type cytochrome triheme protein